MTHHAPFAPNPGEQLRKQVKTHFAGHTTIGDPLLLFDDGLAGLLPLSAACFPFEPEALAQAGISPAAASVTLITGDTCTVLRTRRALYRHLLLADEAPPSERRLLARAARLATEIGLGRAGPGHLADLEATAQEIAAQGLAAAWTLASALRHFRRQWEAHLRRNPCPICRTDAAPCHRTCPANIDIPSFMALLARGDHRATIELIRRDNPLPLVCGLVCPAPCESACLRGGHDGAVFIRPMKANAAEHCLSEGGYPRPELAPESGKRVGIVGSGPAGLAAAYYLRILGHAVEIFEAQPEAGGMLRYGIPAYRLPPELLGQELEQIRTLGVSIHTNAPIDDLERFWQAYDAVFVGPGAQRARLIPIEGVEQPFVLGGVDFLRRVRSGEPVRVGPRVVVIGGGNVAVDVALTALRQGASQADMVFLEQRREMPASPHEVRTALNHGVKLHPGWGPLRIEADGAALFQHCERVKDEQGRFAPRFDPERLLKLRADHVILAVGQGTDLGLLQESAVEEARGFIVADPLTKMTTLPGVFAGGDGQHGPRTAVEAIRSGKIAAASIDAWLRGRRPDPHVGEPVRRAAVPPLPVAAPQRTRQARTQMPEKAIEEVLGEGNYIQIEEGLTDRMAQDEAGRCLRCDICIGCGLCMAACCEMGIEALRMADTPAGRLAYYDFTRPAERCIGCGACAQVCPTGAIRIEDADGMRRTIITGTVVREQPMLVCGECGAATQTAGHREFVHGRLPEHMAGLLERELCADCARGRGDRPRMGL